MDNKPPLIPTTFCDAPSQRLYLVSSVALLQAYKLIQFFEFIWKGFPSEERLIWLYWSLIESILVLFLIPMLRIPRLRLGIAQRLVLVTILVLFNWLFVGNWRLSFRVLLAFLPRSFKKWFDYQTAIMEYKVRIKDVINPSAHILGTHTIHILPFSTAKLNPNSLCFCLSSAVPGAFVSIPILFNNSIPHLMQYSITNFTTGEKTLYNLTQNQLRPLSKQKKNQRSLEDWVEDEESKWFGDLEDSYASDHQPLKIQSPSATSVDEFQLQRTQHLYNIDVYGTGIVRLERVLDSENMDFRISRTEALIVACPSASFSPNSYHTQSSQAIAKENHKCVGQTEDFSLLVKGLAPLYLTYIRNINGRREVIRLDGITPSDFVTPLISMDPSSLSEKLSTSHRQDYTWAEEQRIEIPLNVSLTSPGDHIYQLGSVKDACGHTLEFNSNDESNQQKKATYSKRGPIGQRSAKVHSRSQISFVGCGNAEDEPLRLLKGQSVSLRIEIQEGGDLPDPPWTIGVAYRPSKDVEGGESKSSHWKKEFVLKNLGKTFSAREAGVYEITSINGKHCQGDVLVPSSCLVVEQPMPSVELNFTTITDQCSGEIGLKANMILTGKAPFSIHYLISQAGRSPQQKVKIIQHSRDEILIQPDSPGHFEYRFVRLDDQYYQNVKIVEKTIKQTVHPLAQAKFVKGGRDENIWSCSGETVAVEIELKGASPYSIVYQIQGESPRTVNNLNSSRATIDISIPKQYVKKGGSFLLSLISITDGNGCLRNLTVQDLNIEVHRTKPTAKFYGTETELRVISREAEAVSLPMRLTGNGPWRVQYTKEGSDELTEQVLYGPNDELIVQDEGKYILKSVHDSHCPGVVSDSVFTVEWLQRPTLMVSSRNSGDLLRGVLNKLPVCELSDDSVELTLEGTPPFSVKYSINYKPHRRGEKTTKDHRTIQILKSTGLLPMHTVDPGEYTYTITGLSDRVYTQLSSIGLLNSHRSGDIQIRQQVFPLPEGTIYTLPKTTYCVDETLSDTQRGKGVKLDLVGRAPFEVEIEVKNQASQIAEFFDLKLKGSSIVSVPYTLRSAVPHSVALKSIKDSNGCVSSSSRNMAKNRPAVIEVAETASIKPLLNKAYYCVGESLDFLLKGSPPWLIKYEFNRKKSSVTITSREEARFSRLAKEPGLFKILGVAHKEDLCIAKFELEKEIKPIPTVRISSGRNFIEDIREGDQSEIVFMFEGAPPFSFTYTRSSPTDRGDEQRVLETRTVTGIEDYSYSIFAREEGTWSVTYVQDAFCSFPPVSEITSKQAS
ncbi:hypothetical protein BY996DRAFT_4583365 [Phakopsora pachyrhizi]|uniref:Nucleoporin Pom152 n=1 Tax=Phakopsora pachyrhizi TaxID=170000 RepID=A0AAV0BE44_PHAPC|nr:hypothetical protein BY996DRAFT_4583365 [Phakopsora pachyrhizi]CAH7685401.1 hypothetical protein PPACK8108_LOCUS19916 [Phakopsora pachyrhizi]